jgi:hypothetical protein
MKIVYSKALDGRAAASIINNEYGVISMMNENDFIQYDRDVIIPVAVPGETWFFMDIELNLETFEIIKTCVNTGCKVIHIDKHNNEEFINLMTVDELGVMEKITRFYDTSESTTLLTWIYVNMPMEWRDTPMEHTCEFGPGYSHAILDDISDRLIRIPYGFRLVNDQEAGHNEYEETSEFTFGLLDLVSAKPYHFENVTKLIKKYKDDMYDSFVIHPMSKIWGKIQNDDMRLMMIIITNGKIVLGEKEKEMLRVNQF